jgi:hypothetical protein
MYSTDDLVQRAVQALLKMQKVEAAKVSFITAELSVANAGVEAHAVAAKTETVQYRASLPDILAYLQKETELMRHRGERRDHQRQKEMQGGAANSMRGTFRNVRTFLR